MSSRWPSGTPILLRFGRFGRSRWVLPAIVAEDTSAGLAAWVCEGTAIVRGSTPDGRRLRQADPSERRTTDRSWRYDRWQGPGALLCFPTGKPWSIWWLYHPDGRLREVKGDLGEPVERWTREELHGVDGSDHALDVIFDAAGNPRLRDEAEFEAKIGRDGYWDAPRAERIRRDANELISQARTGQWPFDHWYESFTPDSSWRSTEALPPGWDHPHRIETWRVESTAPDVAG